MKSNILQAIFTAVVISALAACSQAPAPTTEKKAEVQKPVEPVAAQTAFFEMYKPAYSWAKDLLPLSLASNEIPGVKNEDGKAAMWTAVFVSPSRNEARTFFWAMQDSGTEIHKGVSIGGSQAWSGPVPRSLPFQITEFSVNSDAACKTAFAKGADWLTKHPGLPVSLYLGKSSRVDAPVWYIQWGTAKMGYAAFVNATTGEIVKK